MGMDRVRFGRALGVGAREAAKALVKAADAATAPSPAATNPTITDPTAPSPATTRKAGAAMAQRVERAKVTAAGVKRGGRSFGQAVWTPVVKASGVLWLEVTGVLFGMFALVIGIWVWNNRRDLVGVGVAKERAWAGAVMLAVFAYCTVSSYVKAAKRQRQ